MKRTLVTVVLAIVLVLGITAARMIARGGDALAAGDAAAAEGRDADAIASWEAAAREYVPLAPHVDAAYQRLVAIGAQDRTNPARRLAAWRDVRSAALATRGLWTPHVLDLERANAMIAELASRDPEGAAAAGANAVARRLYHATQLAADRRPGPGQVAFFVGGIAVVVVGIGLLIRFTRRAARR